MRSQQRLAGVVVPPAPLPDGWYDVYRWFLRITPSPVLAEELTAEVCRRMRSGQPAWLADRVVSVRERFFVAQVMCEHHRIPDDGLSPSAGRSHAHGVTPTAEAVRHVATTMVAPGVGSELRTGSDERAGEMVGVQVARILANLAAGGPAESWPAQLVRDCSVALQMSGVGLAVMGPDGPAAVLAATSGHAQRMEDLQFSLGEGPCVDASRSGRPVLIPDLAALASHRWPAFTPEATGAGVHAAFTFPLQVGAIGIGVLDLYRTTRGDLDDAQLSQALAFTDAAVAVLLHLQDRSATAEAGIDGVGAVDRRAVVHQATGMISVQLDVSLAVAMSRLRAHAYAAGRPILEVAADVVDRRLEFDGSDAGTSAAPPRRRPSTTGEEESS